MSDAVHQFTMGEFTGYVLNEGIFTTGNTSTFFDGASPSEVNATLEKYGLSPDIIHLPVFVIMLERDDQRILVDAGVGIWGRRQGLGLLEDSLAEVSFKPEDITHVIITHIHFDHSGGVITKDNQPTYPNAKYYLARGAFQYWTEDLFKGNPEAETDTYNIRVRNYLTVIKPQLEMIDAPAELLPGIHAIPTPGHTANHTSLHVVSGDEHLVITSDAIVHPAHIEHITWRPAWNVDVKQTEQSIHKLLELAVSHNALMFCCHFERPGLGHVTRDGDGWKWNPQT